MNQLWLQGNVRNYWGAWEPPSIGAVSPLNDPECYRPTWYVAPPFDSRTLAIAAHLQTDLSLPAGSFIYGMSGRNTIQVTDVGLGHKWFNTPTDVNLPNLLWFPEPYPVTAPGVLRIDFYNPSASATDSLHLIFYVAEPRRGV
jgi:hypothetical protein